MHPLLFVILVLAAVCFFLASINVPSPVNLTALGLFLCTLVFLIRAWPT